MSKNSLEQQQHEVLKLLVSMKMPFGKYKGRVLCDLPEPYLVWFKQNGFPEGKLGMLLASLYEIKLNGLEKILYQLKLKINQEKRQPKD